MEVRFGDSSTVDLNGWNNLASWVINSTMKGSSTKEEQDLYNSCTIFLTTQSPDSINAILKNAAALYVVYGNTETGNTLKTGLTAGTTNEVLAATQRFHNTEEKYPILFQDSPVFHNNPTIDDIVNVVAGFFGQMTANQILEVLQAGLDMNNLSYTIGETNYSNTAVKNFTNNLFNNVQEMITTATSAIKPISKVPEVISIVGTKELNFVKAISPLSNKFLPGASTLENYALDEMSNLVSIPDDSNQSEPVYQKPKSFNILWLALGGAAIFSVLYYVKKRRNHETRI